MRLNQNRSYIAILWSYMAFFAASMVLCFVGFARVCFLIMGITMPALMLGLLALQIRSGIALDSWWVARHPKGTWQFSALIAWQLLGVVLMLGMVYYMFNSQMFR